MNFCGLGISLERKYMKREKARDKLTKENGFGTFNPIGGTIYDIDQCRSVCFSL